MGDYANEHTRAWAATIARYDAFVFVSPEYNRSIRSAVPSKNAIDFLYQELDREGCWAMFVMAQMPEAPARSSTCAS